MHPNSADPRLHPNHYWIRSRYGLSMHDGAELVEDFSALITGSRIAWTGPWKQRPQKTCDTHKIFSISGLHSDPAAENLFEWEGMIPDSHGILDLGDVILFPGLINAHAHLEYTHLAGLHPSTHRFTEWIQWIVRAKMSWTDEDYESSWRTGAAQSLKHGCLWIADHQSHWQEWLIGAAGTDAGSGLLPKIFAFPEYIGFLPNESTASLFSNRLLHWKNQWNLSVEEQKTLRDDRALQKIGISPHAPYTTLADGLKELARLALGEELQCAIHTAESEDELEMFLNGSGPLAELMQRLGRPVESRRQTPLAFLNETGILRSDTILAHANHLNEEDWKILNQKQCSVVHTPRCHEYFQRDRFPIEQFTAAGISVSIGTDSLASIEISADKEQEPELDLKAEAREFLRQHPGETHLKTLQRLTTIPAKTLGLDGEAGVIAPDAGANLAWISANQLGKRVLAETAAACLLNFQGPVSGIVLSGLPFKRRESSGVKGEVVKGK